MIQESSRKRKRERRRGSLVECDREFTVEGNASGAVRNCKRVTGEELRRVALDAVADATLFATLVCAGEPKCSATQFVGVDAFRKACDDDILTINVTVRFKCVEAG